MTLEELLNKPAAELDKLTREEMHAFWEPMLKVTRPELVAKENAANGIRTKPSSQKQQQDMQLQLKMAKLREIAAKNGYKL